MALESKKEGNVITKLASAIKLPMAARARQLLDHSHYETVEIPEIAMSELRKSGMAERIRPGMSVAITCGSRGVANIALLTRTIVEFVKECGGEPFVFPAMGSHGGATVPGQLAILDSYGVTEEFIGCPIRATMEVDEIGRTPEDKPVYWDRYANAADAVILCGRVKAHTAFRGPYESGILKMAVIGAGKQAGAEAVHADGFKEMGKNLPILAKVIFDNCKVIGALATVENAFDETCLLKAMVKEDIWEEEPKLLTYSKTRLGKIFFDPIDVLVVDKLGKDISGDGMDPNVTGRWAVPWISGPIDVQRIAVLDLTEATHGNCNGIGLADVTTKRLVDKVDVDCTYPNVFTSTVMCTPKIPFFCHSDRAAIQTAVRSCNFIDKENPRIVRIKDTMRLEEIWISEALYREVEAGRNPNIELLSGLQPWPFDEEGNLF